MTARRSGSNTARRRRFFYAEAEAGVYDATIDMIVPRYRELHRVVVRLAKTYRLSQGWPAVNVLDVGSGTGVDTVSMIRALPRPYVVAVDCCRPMHDELRKSFSRAFPARRFDRYVSPVTSDILGAAAEPKKLVRSIPRERRSEGFHIAVSSFALHHLQPDEKREAFRRIHDALAPGGAFVLADLFTYATPWLAAEAHRFDMDFIHTRFDAAMRNVGRVGIPASRLVALRDHWIRHYNVDNVLASVEPEANHADSVSDALATAGFENIMQPFRYWQVGVVWAQKAAK